MEWLSAALGGLFGVALTKSVDLISTKERERKEIIARYLSQLQDSTETLAFRLKNLLEENGRGQMTDDYFRMTTLYAVAKVLSMERILMIDGIYSQIQDHDETLNEFLQRSRVDPLLTGIGFHHYERLFLAEFIIQRTTETSYTSNFREFLSRRSQVSGLEREMIEAAERSIEKVCSRKGNELLTILIAISRRLSSETGMKSPFALKID